VTFINQIPEHLRSLENQLGVVHAKKDDLEEKYLKEYNTKISELEEELRYAEDQMDEAESDLRATPEYQELLAEEKTIREELKRVTEYKQSLIKKYQ
jgi:predicted  nucleic acid-binding Zn-ribbon protein